MSCAATSASHSGIGHVRLPAGDVLDVLRVAQPHLEAVLQGVERRLPVHPGAPAWPTNFDLPVGQPFPQPRQCCGRGRKPLLLNARSTSSNRHPNAHRDAVAVNIQSSDPVVDLFNGFLLPSGRQQRPAGEGPGTAIESGVRARGEQSQVPRTLHQTCFGLTRSKIETATAPSGPPRPLHRSRGAPQGHARPCSTCWFPAAGGTP